METRTLTIDLDALLTDEDIAQAGYRQYSRGMAQARRIILSRLRAAAAKTREPDAWGIVKDSGLIDVQFYSEKAARGRLALMQWDPQYSATVRPIWIGTPPLPGVPNTTPIVDVVAEYERDPAMKAQMDAARLQMLIPEGWQLVPREPTDAMLEKAVYSIATGNARMVALTHYRAMLAAAPQPTKESGNG